MATTADPAPESTLPYPPIHKDKKFVVLSDWSVHLPARPARLSMGRAVDVDSYASCRDGTITTRDSNDCEYASLLSVSLGRIVHGGRRRVLLVPVV